VALTLPTASSFGEFYSIYWEALMSAEMLEDAPVVEQLIQARPTVSDVEALAAREGLDLVRSWTNIEEFGYASGEEFLNAPLVKDHLLKNWLEPLDEDEATHARVLTEVRRIIDEERDEAEFALTIKATLVVGQKAE
jgi:hypothetical protein